MNEHRPTEHGRSRDVVTSFLWDGRRVLLAQRSESVSTFPGQWAAISGYLESRDPREWALVEISEECGIDRRHLTLRGAAAPLEISDDLWGAFRVYPFLFAIDNPDEVRPDWEAARLEWIDVEAFRAGARQPMVPRLLEAFHGVWPPWGAERALGENSRMALAFLRNDRSHGAGSLARAAGWELAKLVRLAASQDFASRAPLLLAALDQFRRARLSMAAPANLLADVADAIRDCHSAEPMLEAIARRIHQSEIGEQQAARCAATRLATFRRPLTIGFSGTVLSALQLSADSWERVFVCEGRPLLEGRRLAARLQESGVDTTILTDAQAWRAMPEADCVLAGADAVLTTHDVVNKAGTALLALAARRRGIPFFVVAERLKWERQAGTVVPDESNPPSEVWEDAPAGLHVSNEYFDRVPADLISELVTEDGCLVPGPSQPADEAQ